MVLLDVVNYTEKFASFGEAMGWALPYSLFGFLIVFFVLALLWGILSLMKLFFYTIPQNKSKKASTGAVDSANVVKMSLPDASGAAVLADDRATLVAAITAAVSAYRASVGEADTSFRVVSFKKRK